MENLNTFQQLAYYFSHNGLYVLTQFDRHFLFPFMELCLLQSWEFL